MQHLKAIESLEAKVALIVEQTENRSAGLDALRQTGYTRFSPSKSLPELRQSIEEGYMVDWVLLAFNLNNCASIRSHIIEWRESKTQLPHITVLHPQNAMHLVPELFELGVISAIRTDFSEAVMVRHIRDFSKNLVSCRFDPIYLAASSLRATLKKLHAYSELLYLENCLNKNFLNKRANTLELAEALYLDGKYTEAYQKIDLAVYFDKELKQRVESLERRLDTATENQKLGFAARKGIKKAVIIDEKSETIKQIQDILQKTGVTEISSFDTAENYWLYSDKAQSPDLIVMEWKYKRGISGSQLIQRIRASGNSHTRIILHTATLNKVWASLLSEQRVDQFIPKPTTPKKLLMIIAWTMNQSVQPTEPKTIERGIAQKLDDGENGEATALSRILSTTSGVPPSRSFYVDALIAFAEGNTEKCLLLVEEAISLAKTPSAELLQLKAKAFYKEGSIAKAITIYESAKEITRDSIKQRCWLVEAYLLLGDFIKAKENLREAVDIDAHNQLVLLAQAKIALFVDDRKLLELLKAMNDKWVDLFCFVNSLAIESVHNSDNDRAIDYYLRGLAYLTETTHPIFAILNFNLALVLAKAKENKKALTYLERTIEFGESVALGPAKSLYRSLQKSNSEPEIYKFIIDQESKNHLSVISSLEDALTTKSGVSGIYEVYERDKYTQDLASWINKA